MIGRRDIYDLEIFEQHEVNAIFDAVLDSLKANCQPEISLSSPPVSLKTMIETLEILSVRYVTYQFSQLEEVVCK